MINFENWELTPPNKNLGNTLWKVQFHNQHIGYAIKRWRFSNHFLLTMISTDFSVFQRAGIVALFDATFGANGNYFTQEV